MTASPRQVEERRIAAQVHGTYLVAPPAVAVPAAGLPLLVGFHGYGENAERHLSELRRIPGSDGWLLCAVQALHPFYNQKTGEVVASWMTKLGREQAIADNVRYTTAVVAEVRQGFGAGGPLVHAGFSQGAAMAYRTAAAAGGACSGLIVVGGDVPPELAGQDLTGFPPVLIGRGSGDSWYTAEKLEKDFALLAGKGVEAHPVVYQGGHEWTDEIRQAAGDFLSEILSGGSTPRSARSTRSSPG